MAKFTKTDRKLELEGVWKEYDDGEGNTIKLLIARSDGNPHYDATLTKLMAPHRKKMEKGKSLDNKVAKRIMDEVYAKEILLGWEDGKMLDDDGNNIPYSEEEAIDTLREDNDLRDFVVEVSGDITNFFRQKK